MNNRVIGDRWKDVRKLFTPEEMAESDSKVFIIGELVEARYEKGINQKKLEELSGVKKHDIARMKRKVVYCESYRGLGCPQQAKRRRRRRWSGNGISERISHSIACLSYTDIGIIGVLPTFLLYRHQRKTLHFSESLPLKIGITFQPVCTLKTE